MENNAHKEIKVYGTLLNQTINTNPDGTQSDLVDNTHNDYLTVAYQLYDERFSPKKGSGANGTVINIDRYQDIINKRLTAIDYDPNGDITNIYSNLYVDGDTNIGGDLTVEGDTTFGGDVNITGDINLNMGLNDLNDVTLSTMAIGQVLRYNGSKWVNAKLSIDDLEMPAATAGQVLKFNGTKWVAAEDEVGESGGIPGGDDYPTLKKYRVKMNLIATCTPGIYFKITGDDDETTIKNSGNISYLYKSENEVNIGPGEIILNKAIESFNNDNHYIKYFTSSSKSQLESFGFIAHEKLTINGTVMDGYNTFNRYMILPSVYQSASTENVTLVPERYNRNITYDYFIENFSPSSMTVTMNDVSNNLDSYIPVMANCRSYNVISTSNIAQSGIYGGYEFTTIESGKYVTYCANSKYQDLYRGLLTGPYYKKVYDNNKKTEDDGDLYYVDVTITNISESEFNNKVKWSNGQTTIHVPRKYPFTVLTESSDVQMPDYIYGYITTIS